VALVVVVHVVRGRSSHQRGLSDRVVALGPVRRPSHVKTVVDRNIQHSNLVLDSQVDHLNVKPVVVDALHTGVNSRG